MPLLRIAWRNVWRNGRRSGVTVAAMALGLVVMIVYSALMEGYLGDMERRILELEIGDLQVFDVEYRHDPSVHTRIEDPEVVLGSLEAAGLHAAPRLLAWGLAAVDEASAAASLRGVDVARERTVSRIHEHVASGRWLRPGERDTVVLGRRLARTVAAKVGDELFVLSQGADGSLAYGLFEVVGILDSVGDATDRTAVFLTADAFRDLMAFAAGAHQIVGRRDPDTDLAALAERVRARLPGLDVRTWRELAPTLASMLDSARSAMLIMIVIVYLAIGILILNAMLMAVFERVREIGVLKALGAGPGRVVALIGLESAIQAVLAVAASLAVGIPAVGYLRDHGIDLGLLAGTSVMGIAMDDRWYAVVRPSVFVTPIGMLLAIVAAAVAYPAMRAALVRPVEAMRER